ncbi:MAG: outer membrane lipoprotein carrier protein LolA [Endomicrobium sp.]|jgi:outer membrane lipoprotein carrier protein|nr:outer membrane lipoprotein carrier protein LolA [Endomicrobium sp.]
MKKIIISCLTFLCAQTLFAQNADEIFSKFANVKSVESDFKMERFVSISKTPFESSGHFLFQKPSFLKWEYAKPFAYGFTIEAEKAFKWQNNNGKTEITDISSQPFAKAATGYLYAFISMDKELISKTYAIGAFDEGLVLSPKNNSKSQDVDNIKIYVSKDSPAVSKVVISNKTGDKTEISFSNTSVTEF